MSGKVFISFKNTINGVPTSDSVMATELNNALENAGIATFFSCKSLQEMGVDKYKEIIDSELDNCTVLIVVGTSLENINSGWVKYEWDGFVLDILNGCKKGKVFTYVDNISPHNLPRSLRSLQSFDKKLFTIPSIVDFIKNALNELETESQDIMEVIHPLSSQLPSALNFSEQFLHSGASIIKHKSSDEIRQELSQLSSLYDCIHSVKHSTFKIPSTNIADTIYRIIVDGCRNGNSRKLLKLKGPLGSYKNRLLQYTYLLIEREEKDIIPFYIDLSMYEKSKENHIVNSSKELEQLVTEQFRLISNIISANNEKTPLLIIDGIRDFSSGKDYLYSIVKENLHKCDFRTVVSLDTDFTANTQHLFSLHPLAGMDYEYFIRITSMSIYNKEACITFIKNCLNIFNIHIPFPEVDETVIYNRLLRLNILKIDAYLLYNLLSEMMDNLMNDSITISDLYEAICRRDLDIDGINYAASLAYDFEYGSIDFSNNDFYFDKRWKVIRKHRSVLDYLIARYYVIKFEQLDVNHIENVREQLQFFNMILPKSINVFVAPLICRVDAYEKKVLAIAEKYYNMMTVFEKNQLIYWLGRLNNSTAANESVVFLKQYRDKQLVAYNEMKKIGADARKNAFLLRTLCVSLIARGDKETTELYCRLLLEDKLSNEVNRSFHLIYYGDKVYIPNKTFIDFDDDVKHGDNTFEVLIKSLRSRRSAAKTGNFIYQSVLEIITLISLLQARIEAEGSGRPAMNVRKYLPQSLEFIHWILRQRKLVEFRKINMYISWAEKELQQINLGEITFSPANTYNKYFNVRDIKRTGWISRGIEVGENIVEHMYSCWLMAALYLPAEIEDSNYNKNTILNMLLIHDIAEIDTGDIIKSEKAKNLPYYNSSENIAMHSLLFSDTYPQAQSLSSLADVWDEWNNQDSINYSVASDIDELQAVYQFCKYYMKYPDNFSYEDACAWYEELYSLKTDIVTQLAQVLIFNNPLFKKINDEFGEHNDE